MASCRAVDNAQGHGPRTLRKDEHVGKRLVESPARCPHQHNLVRPSAQRTLDGKFEVGLILVYWVALNGDARFPKLNERRGIDAVKVTDHMVGHAAHSKNVQRTRVGADQVVVCAQHRLDACRIPQFAVDEDECTHGCGQDNDIDNG